MGLRRTSRRIWAALKERKETSAAPKDRVLICGTGRAGTTLLMRIFTNLGLDTQVTREEIAEVEQNVGRAGLEKTISRETAESLPEIIKTPLVVDVLDDALTTGWLRIAHAIIPVRELSQAAASRVSVRERAIEQGMDPRAAPGGLWKTEDPDQQEPALAIQFYKVVEILVAHDVPITFVSFPRFAKDPDYFAEVMGGFFRNRYSISRRALLNAHRVECKPALIGEYRK